MLDGKLQNLVNEFPEYKMVFDAIFGWFNSHPNMTAITMEKIYSNKYGFSRREINIAFVILTDQSILKPVFRVIDYNGDKLGGDYINIDDIPETVDSLWGEKKETKDAFIVPHYLLNQ